MRLSALIAAVGAAATLTFGINATASAETVLRFSHFGPERGYRAETLHIFGKEIADKTGGELQVQFTFGGALLSGKNTLRGVADGVADMGTVVGVYTPAELYNYRVGDLPIGTAGFVSKDMIIESAFAAGEAGKAFGYYAFVLGILAAVMTAFYSWRLIFITFWGPSRLPEKVKKHPHDVPNVMLWPLVPLAIGALFAGMAFYKDFIGSNADKFWNGALYSAADHAAPAHEPVAVDAHGAPVAGHESAHNEEAVDGADHGGGHHEFPAWVIWAPFFAMVFGTLAAAWQYLRGDPLRPGLLRPGGMIYAFLKNKWYFDEIYDFLFVKPALAIGRFLWIDGDGKTIDGVGPDGIASTVAAGARRMVKVQSGYMYHYAFVMLVGIAALITFIFFRLGGGR